MEREKGEKIEINQRSVLFGCVFIFIQCKHESEIIPNAHTHTHELIHISIDFGIVGMYAIHVLLSSFAGHLRVALCIHHNTFLYKMLQTCKCKIGKV